MSVVVITRQYDPTADEVILRLTERGVKVDRFDLAEFPENLAAVGRLSRGAVRWKGTLTTPARTIELSEVRAVWYRKPTRFGFHPGMTTTEHAWSTNEAKAGFGGLLASLPVKWINHPHVNTAADRKPVNLALAASCGLTVADTLITSDPDEAREFCRSQPTGAIYKSLRGGPRSEGGKVVSLFTAQVTADDITNGVSRTAHLFQERIYPKAYEVRLTVVGDALFALRIDARTDAGKADWRSDHDELDYSVTDIPAQVRDGVAAMMKRFGLYYAAFDFIADENENWIFAGDLNPNGQWAWHHPLRDAIAEALTNELEGIPA